MYIHFIIIYIQEAVGVLKLNFSNELLGQCSKFNMGLENGAL